RVEYATSASASPRHAAHLRSEDSRALVRGGRGRRQEDPRPHHLPRARQTDLDVLVLLGRSGAHGDHGTSLRGIRTTGRFTVTRSAASTFASLLQDFF